jgi:hypothetical protein
LQISVRQVRRLLKIYNLRGPLGLLSKKRGQPSNHQLPHSIKELVLSLIKENYPDFGPTFAHEKILELHKIPISVWSVRKIMISNGIWIDKKVKKKRIHQLRERRGKEGELIQLDGSPHDWF